MSVDTSDVMDAAKARERAIEAMHAIEGPGQPLELLAPDAPGEREWCWLFPFNTVRAIQTGAFMDSVLSGPIVVPKDGSEPWVAPSSRPVERWLNEYADVHGLPRVPLPAAPPNPFG